MGRKAKMRIFSLICTLAMIISGFGSVLTVSKVYAAEGSGATVWVIGDSTVCEFNDSYYYPRYGYGTQLYNYFDDTLTVKNLALSGRSSKSYTSETQYQTLMSGMQSGDYLIIGFGHNDEKAEAERYTNPNGDYKTAGSFANSLYENYIKPAQAAGVTVIVCTPIVRRTATAEWSNSNLHITSDSGEFAGGDYPEAIRQLGKDTGVAVVDMTALTKKLYDSLGVNETINLHAWTSSSSTSVDNTHTNIWGAKYNAYMLTQAIKEQGVAGISEHIITAEAPSKADTLVKNPNYVESEYTPVTGTSELWKEAGIWKGTVFGDVGGNPSTANQTLETDADGNIHIAVRNNKGKIGSSDGIAMYYYKVPSSSNFTLTAKATINSFDVNDQVSFGLMARDDMYLDLNTKAALGDYVAAAPLKLTKTGQVWNCFARKSGVLTQGGTCAKAISAGDTVNLKIESNSDGYACTFGDEATITGGFDFKLTSIDSEYVYVGMFVARKADVTFSDVKLVVDGKEVTGGTVTPDPEPTPDPSEGKYDGAVNTELQNFSYNEDNSYLSGQIVVVEWVDTDGDGVRESTVPKYAPKMQFVSTDGTETIDVFVTATGTNTYYFDRLLGGLTEGKEYVFKVTSGDPDNIGEYKTVPVYTGTSGIGTEGTLGNIAYKQDVKFRTSQEGTLVLYGEANNKTYVGNVNSLLSNVSCVTSANGNFVSGNIIITEWIDGVSTVPKTTPVMTFESYDGTEKLDVFMACLDGTNTYYFDRNLSEDMSTEKEYIFRITLTEENNVSPVKSMVATTNYMNEKSGLLWTTDTQNIMYKTVVADGDNQLRVYAVNK